MCQEETFRSSVGLNGQMRYPRSFGESVHPVFPLSEEDRKRHTPGQKNGGNGGQPDPAIGRGGASLSK